MDKWADWLISAVRYDKDESHIEKVRVHEDRGDKVSSETWELTRSQVISRIENGETFVTIYKKNDGKWSKGEDVHIVKVDGAKYIRTDKNDVKEDNLGELPKF